MEEMKWVALTLNEDYFESVEGILYSLKNNQINMTELLIAKTQKLLYT